MAVQNPLVIVTDGAEAIAYLRGEGSFADRSRHPLPCFLLLDLNLPRKSGLEVLADLRQRHSAGQLPVVMFSSSDALQDKERAAALGANDYRVKPATWDDFCAVVRDLKATWLA